MPNTDDSKDVDADCLGDAESMPCCVFHDEIARNFDVIIVNNHLWTAKPTMYRQKAFLLLGPKYNTVRAG